MVSFGLTTLGSTRPNPAIKDSGSEVKLELAFGILWLRRIFSWVLAARFFKWFLNLFLIALSVRPGRWVAMKAHLQHNTTHDPTSSLLKVKLTTLSSYHMIMEKYEYESHYLFPWSNYCSMMILSSAGEKSRLLTSGLRQLVHLSLQLFPLLSSPANLAILGQDRLGFLLLQAISFLSSSSVHRGLISCGPAMMDFPAKMEEINPINFPRTIYYLKTRKYTTS